MKNIIPTIALMITLGATALFAQGAGAELKTLKYGGSFGVGISGMGASGPGFLDVGVTGVYVANRHMQFASQVSYRGDFGIVDGIIGYSGVSVPLLIQFSTDYRRSFVLYALGGVGVDWLRDELGTSVFNGVVTAGVGVVIPFPLFEWRCVHFDIVKLNLGTAYTSWVMSNVRIVF